MMPPLARVTAVTFSLAALIATTGCVERLLRIRSDPTGADIELDGRPIGRAPLDHPFDFYGTVGIVARHERHRSAKVVRELSIPWYEHFPLDFFAELVVPWTVRDVHEVEVRLEPLAEADDVSRLDELEARAGEARERLRSRGLDPPSGSGTHRVEEGSREP